eukprot:TRINITY_DN6033_c0_g1_i2.p1 TRINITY_DN6033_c0_g1~~TRINITY_DN6033_c0_g1_i2.p1  ORF type:complete len:965 (-),score=274.66 TRINITY_DN6033_c0_g1_i2:777-3671(-)
MTKMKRNASNNRLAMGAEEEALDLSVESELTRGVLSNGVQYYVRPNKHPTQEIQIWAYVNAGSLNETEQERGLAHLVEHCVFRGTRSFEDGQIDEFMAALGAAPGADSNAQTSTDLTTYQFMVPWRDEVSAQEVHAVAGTALHMLSDMLLHATLAPSVVDAERSIVLEELRQHTSEAALSGSRLYSACTCGLEYEHREPGGLPDVVKNASIDTVKGFYHKWYRPENITVYIVGDWPDASAAQVVELIDTHFGGEQHTQHAQHTQGAPVSPRACAGLPSPASAREPCALLPSVSRAARSSTHTAAPSQESVWQGVAHSTDLAVRVCEPLGNAPATACVIFRNKAQPIHDRSESGLLSCLAETIVQYGLLLRTQRTMRNFSVEISTDYRWLGLSLFVCLLPPEPDAAREQLSAMLVEVERVRRFGFSEGEMHAVLQILCSVCDDLIGPENEGMTQGSGELITELVEVNRTGEVTLPMTRPGDIVKLARTRITREIVAAALLRVMPPTDTVLFVSAPGFTEPEVAAIAAAAAASELSPLEDEATSDFDSLFPQQVVLPPGTVGKMSRSGAHREWKLSNGLTVKLNDQQTVLGSDEQQAKGSILGLGCIAVLTSKRGLRAIQQSTPELLIPARLCCWIALLQGVAGFTAREYEHFTQETFVRMLNLEAREAGCEFSVEMTSAKLGLGLELMHHLVTQEVKVPTAPEWALVQQDLIGLTRAQDEGSPMDARINAMLWQDSALHRAISTQDVLDCDYATAIQIFNTRLFRSPASMQLSITSGPMDDQAIAALEAQLEQLLASIPACPDTAPQEEPASGLSRSLSTPQTAAQESAIPSFPPGINHQVFLNGCHENATVKMLWCSALCTSEAQLEVMRGWVPQERLGLFVHCRVELLAQMVQFILTDKLNKQLRTASALVYGVQVQREVHMGEEARVEVWTIEATCEVSAVAEVQDQILLVLERLGTTEALG